MQPESQASKYFTTFAIKEKVVLKPEGLSSKKEIALLTAMRLFAFPDPGPDMFRVINYTEHQHSTFFHFPASRFTTAHLEPILQSAHTFCRSICILRRLLKITLRKKNVKISGKQAMVLLFNSHSGCMGMYYSGVIRSGILGWSYISYGVW